MSARAWPLLQLICGTLQPPQARDFPPPRPPSSPPQHAPPQYLGFKWPRYVPDYTKCIDHFALHAGGYAVLKGIQKGMNLPMEMMLPSFASLRDYGNTSSSTTWYSMAYLERFGLVKQGQRIMQVRLHALHTSAPERKHCG